MKETGCFGLWNQNLSFDFRDIKFLFECSTQYLTSERSELVRYWTWEEKFHISKQPSIICLSYKHTYYKDCDNFWRFPTITWRFLEIFSECCLIECYWISLKISKVSRRLLRKNWRCHWYITTVKWLKFYNYMCSIMVFSGLENLVKHCSLNNK